MLKNSLIIKNEVLAMGGTVDEFMPEHGCFYVNIMGKRLLLEKKFEISRQPFASGVFSLSKDITYKLLAQKDLPTPDTRCFYHKSFDQSSAQEALGTLKYPIIIKHSKGSNSEGIFPMIATNDQAVKVLESELPRYKNMIAQEMVFGKEYRVLVLGEKVIGALEMIPPYIVGDGVSTILQSIGEKQKDTESTTAIDETLEVILKEQGYDLTTVLAKGSNAYIKKSSCLAEGGEMRNVTLDVHENIEKICVQASKVVGKHLAGIDVICEDISSDPEKSFFTILEINGKPDLYIHYNPTHGKTQNVVKDIINHMVTVV